MLIVGLNWPTFKWGLGARNWAIVVGLFIRTGKCRSKHRIPACWPSSGGSFPWSTPEHRAQGLLLQSCSSLSQAVITHSPGSFWLLLFLQQGGFDGDAEQGSGVGAAEGCSSLTETGGSPLCVPWVVIRRYLCLILRLEVVCGRNSPFIFCVHCRKQWYGALPHSHNCSTEVLML